MKRTIAIALGDNGHGLATLRYDVQGARENAAFEYDAEWLAAEDRFAIEPGLPLVAGPQFHRKGRHGSVFHGAVADTEPDGWARCAFETSAGSSSAPLKTAGGPLPH